MYALLLICAMAIGQETEASAPPATTGPVMRQFPISFGKAKEVERNIRDNATTKFVLDMKLGGTHGGPSLTIESKSQWAFDRMLKRLKEEGYLAADAVGVEIK